MDPTYQIVGSDGQVYGPVSLDALQGWIREGRVDANTQVHRSDQSAWQPASAFTELALPPPAPAIAPPTPSPGARPAGTPSTGAADLLAAQVKSGAGWFYWIAGLSLINSAASLFGSGWGFALGLGVTRLFDAIALQAGGSGRMVALVLDALAVAVFVFFGYFANQRRAWAFVVGLILYALDGVVFVFASYWIAVGFHVLAAYFIFKGWQACRALRPGAAG